MKVIIIILILFSCSLSQENIEYDKSKPIAVAMNIFLSGGILYFGHIYAEDTNGFLLHSGIGISSMSAVIITVINSKNGEFNDMFVASCAIVYYGNLIWSGFSVTDFIDKKMKQSPKLSISPTLIQNNVGLGLCFKF